MVSDSFNRKIVDFLRQNAVKFDFSDEMSVGDHSKRFKSEDDCPGERERARERICWALCFPLVDIRPE